MPQQRNSLLLKASETGSHAAGRRCNKLFRSSARASAGIDPAPVSNTHSVKFLAAARSSTDF